MVLVMQGGGAPGCYQAGVYQALHEAGIEPDWVIGTSIGAINGAIIAGNPPEQRLARLHQFWDHVEHQTPNFGPMAWLGLGSILANMQTVTQGIPAFFKPNPAALLGNNAKLGVDQASYYSTEPLRETLAAIVDFDYLAQSKTRLTVGAVHVQAGEMRYFDSRDERLDVEHVMASGALPPAFPAVRINGEPYWDGGIYSNTPIEAVLDDKPRRNSTIFAVNVWQPHGPEPQSISDVIGRQKDIQFASRADNHIERQKQIHRLRHVIRELEQYIPADNKHDKQVKELTSWGCGTTMHVVRLLAPRIAGEDVTKDIDFSAAGVHARWEAGYADTLAMIKRAPWEGQVDSIEGVMVHD
ncbi:MAG TPA: patatin-like phospholipase family protein [Burkholderiaceae bacterium]|nr:patatin-like phospholipase family protein [Burkholderiaceae bacterium]